MDSNIITGKSREWRKTDTRWMLGLFGTAIGAGVLFFPISAGTGGLLPFIFMIILAFPVAFLCHRSLARLCLSGENISDNITDTVTQHFGKRGGVVITLLYFFAICPLLWIYGVTITNTFITFWVNQLNMPEINRGMVAFIILLIMSVFICFGKELMVRVMSYLVFPFIACLVMISLSLIPYWSADIFTHFDVHSLQLSGTHGVLLTVWLGIAVMVFSFNFSPVVSSFIVSKREEYEYDYGREFTERKCSEIISRACILMVVVVMFFALSCLLTLSPQDMMQAKIQNIPVLSYLANHFSGSGKEKSLYAGILEYAASIIALVAIFKSFFGHYMGTLEGLNGLIIKFYYHGDKSRAPVRKLNIISMIIIMGSTWWVAYENPNILDLIGAMGAPIIATLLCLLPVYAIHRIPALEKYRGRPENIFVAAVGFLTILNIVYKLF
ncbi:threonine/serine transporter TdcC [Salmonella enterica]|nr:threonine/serine transporter TdcC [Salmonella enterica]